MGFKPIHGGAQLSIKGQFQTDYRRAVKIYFTNATVTDNGNGQHDVFINLPPPTVIVNTVGNSSTPYNIPPNTDFLICTNSNPLTLVLPPPSNGKTLTIKQVGTGDVIITGGLDNGVTNVRLDATGFVLGQTLGCAIQLFSNTTGWFVM
jgi:hypothetical protein